MIVEVVAIGTELLLGQIVDTNSSWIAEQLALVGAVSYRQTKVGDNLDRMVDALAEAGRRSDVVIACGGLGPTQDDLTREAFAVLAGEPLVEDEDMAERIASMFAGRGRRMPLNNLLQARKPPSASFIPVQPGTAPGLVLHLDDTTYYALPGVPWEMQTLMRDFVLADLAELADEPTAIASRTVRTWGESESGLAEMLGPRLAELDRGDGSVTLAFLASGVEGLKVRVTARAGSRSDAEAAAADEAARVHRLLGPVVFSTTDASMEEVVLASLAKRGWSIAVAESLTAGLLGSRLADVPGASRSFLGGVVAYDPEVKFSMLGVERGPVVTERTALAMARGVCSALGSDVGLATTGVAGPDSLEGHPPGTVCLAAVWPGGELASTVSLPGPRRQVREFSCISVLDLLRRHVGVEADVA